VIAFNDDRLIALSQNGAIPGCFHGKDSKRNGEKVQRSGSDLWSLVFEISNFEFRIWNSVLWTFDVGLWTFLAATN
jgi:hypothetical protein